MEVLLDFAERIYKEDRAQMQQQIDFENYIKPLFKEKFNKEYRTEYIQFYSKEFKDFIEKAKSNFNKKLK